MSQDELHKPDAAEVAANEPPRIPLRIWHWFVWSFATISLLAISNAREAPGIGASGGLRQVITIHWSFVGGLILTACIALAIIFRQAELPRPLKWAPGHFLLLGMGTTVLSGGLIYALGQFSDIGRQLGTLLIIYLPSLVVAGILYGLAIKLSTSLLWRSVFIAGLLELLLEIGMLVSLWLSFYSPFLFGSVTILERLVLLGLLVAAVARDLVAPNPPLHIRAWTHWAGVAALFLATVFSLIWTVVLRITAPY